MASGLAATAIGQEQKRLAPRFDGELITLASALGGALAASLFMLAIGDHSVTRLSSGGFLIAVAYGLLFFACSRLSVFGFNRGPMGLGTVLLSVEVVVGPALAYVFFGESLNVTEVVGGVFTGAAVVSTALRRPAPQLAERLNTEAGAM